MTPLRFSPSLASHLPASLALPLFLLVASAAGCATPRTTDAGTQGPPATAGDGWMVLFDGGDLGAWRGYGREDVPSGWRIDDGAIHFAPGGEGGDLITREEYGDFELALEWKIAPCGNSGIFYRGAEGMDYVWRTAPEMQVLDDACHPDARYPSHRAGANYDLHVPTTDAVRPAGEWNEVRIVARGPHVEHWLNGEKVVEYEQGSASWAARVAASKFREMPDYGTRMSGHVALQDHGDPVWYRNVRIRRLD